MDTAAAVIGIPVARNKLAAFAVSSFYCGIAGALWAFAYLGTVDARSFNLDRSFQVMFIIIIGGMGSIVGSFIGAAFIMLLPILIDHVAGSVFGDAIGAGQLENLQKVLFGCADHLPPDQGAGRPRGAASQASAGTSPRDRDETTRLPRTASTPALNQRKG